MEEAQRCDGGEPASRGAGWSSVDLILSNYLKGFENPYRLFSYIWD